ncbi:NDR1/HIN1-like protein 2 [Oryza brachyantha]|uniref:Late embryogenesis abundant protein LEA-2 subgroup domain-containing protein n=1 Tax=Oryza brachyantha TaxID=4533 RepID=J3MLJ9_ORYBR|nr:NDR1/HIN1-like protein 2 [Oryza brachyantha]
MPSYLSRRERPEVRCINFLCAVLLTLVLVAGIIMFVLWLSLRPHRPKFFLDDFAIPNLNRQSGAVNLPVSFTVGEHNPNQKVGIHYDEIFGTVYYNDLVVASGTVYRPFYEPPKGDTPLRGQLTATGPTPGDPAWQRFAADAAAGSVALRLLLNSTVRFQVKVWDTKEHHMKVDCEFRLRGDGTLQQEGKNKQCTLYF